MGSVTALGVATAAVPNIFRGETFDQHLPEAYAIVSMQARLFLHDRGVLSRDILSQPAPVLWNTIIGEGQAGGPSTATLVTIEVSGQPGAFQKEREVVLQATTGGSVVFERASRVGLLSAAGKFYAAFLLYETGCDPLDLVAYLKGQAQESRAKAAIKFACGE